VVTLNAFGDTLIVWLKLFACADAPFISTSSNFGFGNIQPSYFYLVC
jgi:hypothetical protein